MFSIENVIKILKRGALAKTYCKTWKLSNKKMLAQK
jgi:hypothetical protein